MFINNQHSFVARFQNTHASFIFFTDSEESLNQFADFLSKNRNRILKDIKIYDQVHTRYVRANIKMIQAICTTELEIELNHRNYFK